MFGRHHGDEGTSNWIIEGFLNDYFSAKQAAFRDEFQLIVYPMINPDGANNHTRYNKNNRDLNRVWHLDPKDSLDEVGIVHRHLHPIHSKLTRTTVILDMHGSFTEDFIYRVRPGFIDRSFYEKQGRFIDQLGNYDTWQRGNFQLSNGHEKMARIYFVREFRQNAMTHESIRNIPKNRGRTIETLKSQGRDILQTVQDLYSSSL